MSRICIITSIHPDYDPRVYKHCRSMADLGHAVTLIAPWSPAGMDGRIRFRPFPRSPGTLGRLRNARHIWRLAAQTPAELYHFHDLDLCPIMALFALVRRAKVVYDVHENYPLEMLEKTSMPRCFRWPAYGLTWAIQRLACQVIHNVVVVVPNIAEDLPDGLNLIEIRNYASRGLAGPPADDYASRPASAIFLATQYPSNGAGLFLDVAEKVLRRNPEVVFYSIDRFPRNPHLRQQAMSRILHPPFKDRVFYLPMVSSKDVGSYIRRARVGLHLSLDVPKQTRALPTKIPEYMACGVPVIASDLPFCRELVAKNEAGLLARPGDADDFAAKILHVLDHPKEAEEMGQRGRRAVLQQLNWESEMLRLDQFYGGIVARRVTSGDPIG